MREWHIHGKREIERYIYTQEERKREKQRGRVIYYRHKSDQQINSLWLTSSNDIMRERNNIFLCI